MTTKSILLLDTEKNVLQTYQTVLKDEGYSVNIASSKEAALDLLSNQSFSILITELYLQGVNTSDIIKAFKKESPETYIIMVSAVSLNPENYDEIINAGVDDYFTKPLSSTLLLTTIKKGMKRRSLVSKSIYLEEKLKNMENIFASHHDSIKQGKLVDNMRSFSRLLQNEIVRSKRYNHPFSLIILKINDAKKDTTGSLNNHSNQIDNKLLNVINMQTRKTDFVVGYNGNFALMLVETPIEGTRILKDRLQQEISSACNSKMPTDLSTPGWEIDYFPFPEQSDYITTWILSNLEEPVDYNNSPHSNLLE